MIWQATNSGKFWGIWFNQPHWKYRQLEFLWLCTAKAPTASWTGLGKALRGKMLDAARNAKSGAKWRCLNIMSCFYNSSLVCTWSRTSWPMQKWTISKASGWPSASFLSEAGTKQSASEQTARDLVKLRCRSCQLRKTFVAIPWVCELQNGPSSCIVNNDLAIFHDVSKGCQV